MSWIEWTVLIALGFALMGWIDQRVSQRDRNERTKFDALAARVARLEAGVQKD